MVGVVMAVVSFRAPTSDEGGKAPVGAAQRVPASGGVGVASQRERGPTASRPTRTRARESAGGAQRQGAGQRRSWCAHDRRRAPDAFVARVTVARGCQRRYRQNEKDAPAPLWKPKRLTLAVET